MEKGKVEYPGDGNFYLVLPGRGGRQCLGKMLTPEGRGKLESLGYKLTRNAKDAVSLLTKKILYKLPKGSCKVWN